jgi:PAS domain-containing protein
MVAVGHDRKIMECNEAFCSWVGMPYNAVVGRELSSVCELSNLDAIWRLFEAHRGDCAKQTTISPAFLIAPGGISRYVQGNAYALGGGESEPSGILFIFYDIIDEMRRENLRNLTIKSFDSFSWFYDISADSFTFGEDIPGHIPTTSLKTSKDIDRCIHPKDRERVREYFHTCLAEGRSEFDIQFRLDLTGREEYKWRECRGIIETSTMTDNRQVTYLYGIYICIEEIKHYEEYFKQVRTVFDVASREAHIGYARYNLRSGEGSASAQWFENNGIPQESREGYDFRNVYTTTSGRQRDEMMRFYVQAMCRQRSRYQGDTRIVLPDGSVRWTHHNKVVTVNDDDELEMVEINYDITERMQEVVALREAFSDAQVEMQLES